MYVYIHVRVHVRTGGDMQGAKSPTKGPYGKVLYPVYKPSSKASIGSSSSSRKELRKGGLGQKQGSALDLRRPTTAVSSRVGGGLGGGSPGGIDGVWGKSGSVQVDRLDSEGGRGSGRRDSRSFGGENEDLDEEQRIAQVGRLGSEGGVG